MQVFGTILPGMIFSNSILCYRWIVYSWRRSTVTDGECKYNTSNDMFSRCKKCAWNGYREMWRSTDTAWQQVGTGNKLQSWNWDQDEIGTKSGKPRIGYECVVTLHDSDTNDSMFTIVHDCVVTLHDAHTNQWQHDHFYRLPHCLIVSAHCLVSFLSVHRHAHTMWLKAQVLSWVLSYHPWYERLSSPLISPFTSLSISRTSCRTFSTPSCTWILQSTCALRPTRAWTPPTSSSFPKKRHMEERGDSLLKQTQKLCQKVLKLVLVMKAKHSTLESKRFVKERRDPLLTMSIQVMSKQCWTRWTGLPNSRIATFWCETCAEYQRSRIQKIENHPDRHAIQQDLRQNQAQNTFSPESKKMIQGVGNIELFELLETDPTTQCKACLLYCNVCIVYCTCGHFL